MKRWLLALAAALLVGPALHARGPTVGLIRIDGAIGPATANYISRAIGQAASRSYTALVIQLDTPGGLLESTKTIVQALYASPVPTIVYVGGSGATATSAGCFITLAADVAAMAPHTSIGAAHPVEAGATGQEQKPDDVMTKKIENYAVSYIETIAGKRHRNVEWAKESVRSSASITSEQALQLNVIDLIADDPAELLAKLDGKTVNDRLFHTAGAAIVEMPMTLRERVFQTLWRPEVIFILMLVAVYGILGEISHPGAVAPGVVGVIALVLVLYLGAALPINAGGVVLILVALVLFVVDVFTPTHGALTVGGLVAFVIGSLMLFDVEPQFKLRWTLVVPSALITAALFALMVGAGLRAQRQPPRTGAALFVGRIVPSLTRIDADDGRVLVEGEYWKAVSGEPVEAGRFVEIVARHGLTLTVKPASQEAPRES